MNIKCSVTAVNRFVHGKPGKSLHVLEYLSVLTLVGG
jgi:hypothetical protein